MNKSYKILFRVEVNHDYYTNGTSRDFEIFPTQETATWFRRNNMVFRRDDTGFRVYYTEEKNSSPSAPFTSFDAEQLRFMLFLKNKEIFFNITDLNIGGSNYTSGQLFLAENDGFVEDLELSLIDGVRPFVFSYKFPQVEDPPSSVEGQIEVFNPLGNEVVLTQPDPNTVSQNQEGVFTYPIDLTGYPRGEYTFKTKVDETDLVEKQIYIDNRVMAEKPFGLVAIDLPSSTDEFQPNSVFKVDLKKKEPKWKYFMLMKNFDPELDYSVIDSRSSSVFTFTEKDSVIINGIDTLVFESDQEIPLNEVPLNFMQLLDATENVIINGLSNPVVNVISANPASPEVYEIYVNV